MKSRFLLIASLLACNPPADLPEGPGALQKAFSLEKVSEVAEAENAAQGCDCAEQWPPAGRLSEAELTRQLVPGYLARSRPRIVMPSFEEETRVDVDLRDDPALVLARIFVSEEGWERPEGWDALWQVVVNVRARHCDTTRRPPGRLGQRITQCEVDGEVVDVELGETHDGEETPLSAMRRLSMHVTGMVPPIKPRQEWTSTLQPSDEPPTGWRECTDEGGACDGNWDLYVARWSGVREHASRLMSRSHVRRTCEHRVIAWGGEMDRPIMANRNAARRRAGLRPLVRIDCGDTANEYYGVEAIDGRERQLLGDGAETADQGDGGDLPRGRSRQRGEEPGDVDSDPGAADHLRVSA